jgi:hypothetical protein
VNYAVKSSLLLSFLESVPDVAAKLKEPNTKDESFEEVVEVRPRCRRSRFGLLNEPLTPALSPPRGEGEDAAAVLVLVY